MATKISFLLTLCWTTYAFAHLRLPLIRYSTTPEQLVNTERYGHYVSKPAGHAGPTVVPEMFAQREFWYAKFDVGDSKGLNLTIDTGSPFVVTNPSLYKPSSSAVNLHRSGNDTYDGTQSDACGTLTIYWTAWNDTVSVQGLTARNQRVVDTHHHKATVPGEETQLQPPFQGIVGFGGNNATYTVNVGGIPFFATLCDEKKIAECRFALAFGTAGTGHQVLGGIDHSVFDGDLSSATLIQENEWFIEGNVVAKGSTFSTKQQFFFDSGTSNIQGPIAEVRKLFTAFGLKISEKRESDCAGGNVIFGYYPCNSPPDIAFTVGNRTFGIEPAAAALQRDGRTNCTSTIVGVDYGKGEGNFWLIGQSFMEGKYVDFDLAGKGAISVALLKDPSGAT